MQTRSLYSALVRVSPRASWFGRCWLQVPLVLGSPVWDRIWRRLSGRFLCDRFILAPFPRSLVLDLSAPLFWVGSRESCRRPRFASSLFRGGGTGWFIPEARWTLRSFPLFLRVSDLASRVFAFDSSRARYLLGIDWPSSLGFRRGFSRLAYSFRFSSVPNACSRGCSPRWRRLLAG